jgi:phage tail-like protein
MSELRPFALLRTGDQWMRCSFEATFLDVDAGIVELARTTATADSDQPAPRVGAGLGFDNACRLYHSRPSENRVERIRWKATDPLGPVAGQPQPVDLFTGPGSDTHGAVGDFAFAQPAAAVFEPRGVALDVNDRLFVAETGGNRILIYDLWSERLVRRVILPGARPTDLAAHGNDVYAVLAARREIVRLTARSGPDPVDLPAGCTEPSRIAIAASGTAAILEKAGTPDAHVWFNAPGLAGIDVPFATDVEWQSIQVLVVARQPGADFRRYEIQRGELVQLPSLRARGYDGLGIVATPDCLNGTTAATQGHRIGYWTPAGFRDAVAARPIFDRVGRVTTFRLDSGAYQTVWGRLFIDACIPAGADLRVHCIVADEADDDTPIFRVPPANVQQITIRRPDLSPPMPPVVMAPGTGDVSGSLHLRESGRELPWTPLDADDHFDTYEAPIGATPGRFLWVTLELRGNTRVSPKVRCLRAEYPAHDYLRRLPQTLSRDAAAASFLLRYLAMFEGFLGETEARGVDRDLLLDPRSAPAACLPWLASFVGLVLDERWAQAPSPDGRGAIDARRAIIREAVWLFRYRGTVPGLKRFIELYVGVPVLIMEHYRMRGIGAAVLGEEGSAFTSSIVGVGFRIGGAVGSATALPVDGRMDDAFRTHAHRFTVIVPAALTEEQLDVVTHIIQVHRPAHTLFDICTAGVGMRVGRGLLLAISSVIGPTGGFSPFQTGSSVLGRGSILGRPGEGGRLGASRIGGSTRVG